MLRTILLDLGNVVLFFSHERMFQQMGDLCGLTGEEIRQRMRDHNVIVEFETGRMNRSEFHRVFESWTGQKVDRRKILRAASNIFTPNESLIAALDRIKRAGVRLVLLSNTNAAHIAFIKERFDVLSKFDELVLSYQVRAMKPDPPIFEAALKAIQCEPRECFYTDDIVENVERARGFGLQAEVFIDTQTFLSQLEQRNLILREMHFGFKGQGQEVGGQG
jgi:putative hydrolase of the HAD superfamily